MPKQKNLFQYIKIAMMRKIQSNFVVTFHLTNLLCPLLFGPLSVKVKTNIGLSYNLQLEIYRQRKKF